jgi:hypothetical protein
MPPPLSLRWQARYIKEESPENVVKDEQVENGFLQFLGLGKHPNGPKSSVS